jgi:hypothetical protein
MNPRPPFLDLSFSSDLLLFSELLEPRGVVVFEFLSLSKDELEVVCDRGRGLGGMLVAGLGVSSDLIGTEMRRSGPSRGTLDNDGGKTPELVKEEGISTDSDVGREVLLDMKDERDASEHEEDVLVSVILGKIRRTGDLSS